MTRQADPVLFHTDAAIGFITLNRPERLNAFNADMAAAWAEAASSAVADPDVRAIVIQAEGRAFCAGGDVLAMAEGGGAVGGGVEELAAVINGGITALVQSSVPVVAAVQGTAVGGGLGILLSSDYAVGAVDARIGSLYADMGLTPDLSVSAHLTRAVGERRALQLTLTSRLLSADEALDWGLLAEVTNADQVRTRALAVARGIAEGAAWAYGQAKRLIRSAATRTFAEQLAEEARTIARAVGTPDAAARMSAFAARAGS